MAARKFLTPVDLTKNELQNPVLQNLASGSSMTATGQFCYDTTLQRFVFKTAGGVIDPTNRANHTGTQLASTISNFDTQVQTSRLDQLANPTASVSLNTQKLTNVANGTSASDAATYGQLQGIVNGTDWKASCRIATTANITLSGLTAVDGITPVAGDRVLVKNQTTGTQNGIYVAASGAWTRSVDAADGTSVTPAMTTMIEEGSVNADTQWRLINDGAITIGTTALVFTQIGGATSYTAGTGIVVTGTVVSIDQTVVPRKFSSLIGDGTSTSISVTHGLGTLDAIIQVYDPSTGATVDCDTVRTSTSAVTIGFSVAPTANQYRVVVLA